jgi:2-keto-4-pentenoate hydratase/2-oxohepta-3-ene-1,7-dioic acid hydratase in catechol pathway
VTLKPGDVVLTGTPPGVGCFRNPPIWLKVSCNYIHWLCYCLLVTLFVMFVGPNEFLLENKLIEF